MGPSLTASVVRRGAGRKRPLAALAGLRGATYGLLGSLFVYPARSDLTALAAEGDRLLQESLVRGFPFRPSLNALVDRLVGLNDEQLERLEQEYVDLFLVSASQLPCPPYESAYVERRGWERGLVPVAVERAYADAGLSVADQGEPPDHAAVELGFLSLLCGEEERSWRRSEAETALDWMRRQEEFHEQHLGRWFPAFCARLESVAVSSGLYGALARAGHAFVTHDSDLVRALVQDRSVETARLGGSRS